MDLTDFYPCASSLVESELSVLDHLQRNTFMNEKHPQVAAEARNYYPRYRGGKSGFQFNSHFDIWHQQMPSLRGALDNRGRPHPNARLTVSALIEVVGKSFTNVSYCLSVCRIRGRNPQGRVTILRKFHFDVTVGAHAQIRRQPHPRCHLQYCGEMVPYMATVGCRDEQLKEMHPGLSEPRIFFWPMSLALLIDMALHEFPDQDSAKFRLESYWRSLVRNQEALVLRPFFKKCVEIIKDSNEENRTLADAFYVG